MKAKWEGEFLSKTIRARVVKKHQARRQNIIKIDRMIISDQRKTEKHLMMD